MTIVRWGKSISGVFVDVADVSLQSSNHQNAIQRTDHNNSAQSNEYFGHFQRKYVLLFPISTVISHSHQFSQVCVWLRTDIDEILSLVRSTPFLIYLWSHVSRGTWLCGLSSSLPPFPRPSQMIFCSCCLTNPCIFDTDSKSKLILN